MGWSNFGRQASREIPTVQLVFGSEDSVDPFVTFLVLCRSGSRPAFYTRSSAHAWTICSGTASKSRGFSCITYSFSMW